MHSRRPRRAIAYQRVPTYPVLSVLSDWWPTRQGRLVAPQHRGRPELR